MLCTQEVSNSLVTVLLAPPLVLFETKLVVVDCVGVIVKGAVGVLVLGDCVGVTGPADISGTDKLNDAVAPAVNPVSSDGSPRGEEGGVEAALVDDGDDAASNGFCFPKGRGYHCSVAMSSATTASFSPALAFPAPFVMCSVVSCPGFRPSAYVVCGQFSGICSIHSVGQFSIPSVEVAAADVVAFNLVETSFIPGSTVNRPATSVMLPRCPFKLGQSSLAPILTKKSNVLYKKRNKLGFSLAQNPRVPSTHALTTPSSMLLSSKQVKQASILALR